MKEKYIFLIGFGFGIVFVTFIAFFVYNLDLKNNENIKQEQLKQVKKEYVIYY